MLLASSAKFNYVRKVVAQPKADGWRLMAVTTKDGVVFYTRNLHSEPFTTNLRFLAEELGELPRGIVLDGELVRDDFDTIAQWRRDRLSEKEIDRMAQDTTWMLFDMYDPGRPKQTWTERHRRLQELVPETEHIMLTPTVPVKNEKDLQKLYNRAIASGMEGIVVKYADSIYVPGARSRDWVKMKAFETLDGQVIGFEEGSRSNRGTLGALVVKCQGKTIKISGFTSKMKDKVWRNKKRFLGKWVSFSVMKDSWRMPLS